MIFMGTGGPNSPLYYFEIGKLKVRLSMLPSIDQKVRKTQKKKEKEMGKNTS